MLTWENCRGCQVSDCECEDHKHCLCSCHRSGTTTVTTAEWYATEGPQNRPRSGGAGGDRTRDLMNAIQEQRPGIIRFLEIAEVSRS